MNELFLVEIAVANLFRRRSHQIVRHFKDLSVHDELIGILELIVVGERRRELIASADDAENLVECNNHLCCVDCIA